MIVIKCIDRIRNKRNEITHYRIHDKAGKIIVVRAAELKQAMIEKKSILHKFGIDT